MDAHQHHHSPAPPSAIDERSSRAGLRTVAIFEAIKGGAVVALGIFLLFMHAHAEDFVASLLFHLHIDPDRQVSHALLHAAEQLSDARLLTIAAAALSYATVRLVEAWGLWNRRVWAEWFALLSGTLYLPWECLKVAERADIERVGVLAINILIIVYMLWVRISSCRPPKECATEQVTEPDTETVREHAEHHV
ncbi:MAG TPA: DUF2127 domain-containing protein [Bryobacteraceae bacterium]|jgi:uncharacterized membrane protein (DUF2068 family)|nr:DUF2127 domain-containing protein [Bryobacteraceae bacterium]